MNNVRSKSRGHVKNSHRLLDTDLCPQPRNPAALSQPTFFDGNPAARVKKCDVYANPAALALKPALSPIIPIQHAHEERPDATSRRGKKLYAGFRHSNSFFEFLQESGLHRRPRRIVPPTDLQSSDQGLPSRGEEAV